MIDATMPLPTIQPLLAQLALNLDNLTPVVVQ